MQIQAKSKIEVPLQEIVFSNGATVSLFFMISETEQGGLSLVTEY